MGNQSSNNNLVENQLGALREEEWQTTFYKIAGKDGYLDKATFEKHFPRSSSRDVLGKSLFSVFDLDGSGKIDFTEFSFGLVLLTHNNLERKLNALFRLLDVNDDKRVDETELRVFAERIVKAVRAMDEMVNPDASDRDHTDDSKEVDAVINSAFEILSPRVDPKVMPSFDSIEAKTKEKEKEHGKDSGKDKPVVKDGKGKDVTGATAAIDDKEKEKWMKSKPAATKQPRQLDIATFTEWALKDPRVQNLINSIFSVTPADQLTNEVRRQFEDNLRREVEAFLPMSSADLVKKHALVSGFWLEVFDRRVNAMKSVAAGSGAGAGVGAVSASTSTSTAAATTTAAAAGGGASSKAADDKNKNKEKEKEKDNMATSGKERRPSLSLQVHSPSTTSLSGGALDANGVPLPSRIVNPLYTFDISDVTSPLLTCDSSRLDVLRKEVTNRGDAITALKYFMRVTSLDRLITKNDQASAAVCQRVLEASMAKITAATNAITANHAQAYVKILFDELYKSYILDNGSGKDVAKGPERLSELVKALQVNLDKHIAMLIQTTTKEKEKQTRALAEMELKDRLKRGDEAEAKLSNLQKELEIRTAEVKDLAGKLLISERSEAALRQLKEELRAQTEATTAERNAFETAMIAARMQRDVDQHAAERDRNIEADRYRALEMKVSTLNIELAMLHGKQTSGCCVIS